MGGTTPMKCLKYQSILPKNAKSHGVCDRSFSVKRKYVPYVQMSFHDFRFYLRCGSPLAEASLSPAVNPVTCIQTSCANSRFQSIHFLREGSRLKISSTYDAILNRNIAVKGCCTAMYQGGKNVAKMEKS